jgi:hypothetical protein
MASKCPNLGKQVGTTNFDWSDDDEPILSSPPICKDSYKWNPRVDCLCLTVLSDKPIEPMESPPVGSQLKNLIKSLALIRY